MRRLLALTLASAVLVAACSSQEDAGVTTRPDGGASTGGSSGSGGASTGGSSGGGGASTGGSSGSGGASTGGSSGSGGGSTGGSSGSGGASGAGGGAGTWADAGTLADASADVCALPPEVGPCDAAFRRFYFDRTSGKCSVFIYGGCGGNENNFRTATECVAACAPAAPAPCDAVSCEPGRRCVYVRGAEPVCAAPCLDGGTCNLGLTCGCGASCPYCKNCVQACL